MEVKLNTVYSSNWDNIEYPIFQLADESYLCIAYSSNHHVYYMNIYTKEDFIEQGFEEADYCDVFDGMSRDDIAL